MRRAGAAFLASAALAGSAEGASFDCVLDPSEVVRLASPSGGIIAGVEVGRGSEVEAGQVVARLSSAVETATLRVLEMRAENRTAVDGQAARLAFLEKRLERARSLAERGVGTREAVEELEAEIDAVQNLLLQAEAELAIAAQELERARLAVSLLELRSPIDGIVTERARAVGEYLHPESHVLTIVAVDPLHVETFLPAAVFGQVAVGDPATVRPAPPLAGEHEAEVAVIDRVLDVASGTFGVRLRLPNPDGALPAGHRCTVEFSLPDSL